MGYIFYVDVYFLQNVFMKIVALYLAITCSFGSNQMPKKKWLVRVFRASICGTIIEIIGLICVKRYTLFTTVILLVEVPFMISFVLGKERKKILSTIFRGYFFVMVINSVLEMLWNRWGEEGSFLFFLVFACVVVIIGTRIWRNDRRMKKGIYEIKLKKGDKIYKTLAFYDSGNQLKDPYTQKGVHIISEQLFEELELKNPVYVPYQALGNENSILEVYYVEELNVYLETQEINLKECPMGVTKDNLFEGKKYKVILNEEVF